MSLLEKVERDHRLPEDQLALVGPVNERSGEWERILQLRGLRVEQVVPHARHHGADVYVAAGEVLSRDRPGGGLKGTAVEEVSQGADRSALARAIGLGDTLKLQTIAEGIERAGTPTSQPRASLMIE